MKNPFLFDQNHRLKILNDIEKLAPRVKNKCLHISFNPSKSDSLVLDDKTIRMEIRQMMEHMGYGNQPYFYTPQIFSCTLNQNPLLGLNSN